MKNTLVEGQEDLFVDFDPTKLKGALLNDGQVELIDTPVWREDLGKWVALANVRGMLALVSLNITVRGERL
jgi:hypothetical protein